MLLLLALYLVYQRVECKVKRLFERLALVLYKVGVLRHIHFYFSYLIPHLLRFVIQFQVYICRYYLIMKCLELLNFGIYMIQELLVGIEMHGLNLYIHSIQFYG